jgi:hypothetical protein
MPNTANNDVTVADVAAVNLNGSQNQPTWTGAEQHVSDNGSGNTVSQG